MTSKQRSVFSFIKSRCVFVFMFISFYSYYPVSCFARIYVRNRLYYSSYIIPYISIISLRFLVNVFTELYNVSHSPGPHPPESTKPTGFYTYLVRVLILPSSVCVRVLILPSSVRVLPPDRFGRPSRDQSWPENNISIFSSYSISVIFACYDYYKL